MKTFFGNYREKILEGPPLFRIEFAADEFFFKWEYCGLTADFTGNYLCNVMLQGAKAVSLSDETAHAIRYIVNELLENTLKFRCLENIIFSCAIDADELVFMTANTVNSSILPALVSKLENISNGNTETMFFERLEKNAASETQTGSGLGYLTMINDYGAEIGWKIESIPDEKECLRFETMVFLKIINNKKEVNEMEMKGSGYSLNLDEKAGIASFKGTFRCSNEEYAEITKALNDTAGNKPEKMTLDLTEMEFLNSSGINMFAKFVISMRNKGETALEMKGSSKFPWQGKSLPNLKKLYPAMTLTVL